MKGAAKKKFFDFVQTELEMSLERLSKLLVKDLTEYIEMGDDKTVTLKESFFSFKQRATEIRNTVKNHFEKLITEMIADFPSVIENEEAKGEDSSDDEATPTVNKELTWCCFVCTTVN